MADLPHWSELEAKGQQNLLKFLETDLALCFTFIEVAITDLNAPEEAREALLKAEEGYATVSRFFPRLQESAEKNTIGRVLIELDSKLRSLRMRLDSVGQPSSDRLSH
jgi:hypothetical protein